MPGSFNFEVFSLWDAEEKKPRSTRSARVVVLRIIYIILHTRYYGTLDAIMDNILGYLDVWYMSDQNVLGFGRIRNVHPGFGRLAGVHLVCAEVAVPAPSVPGPSLIVARHARPRSRSCASHSAATAVPIFMFWWSKSGFR